MVVFHGMLFVIIPPIVSISMRNGFTLRKRICLWQFSLDKIKYKPGQPGQLHQD
jgi:hypothetical protein